MSEIPTLNFDALNNFNIACSVALAGMFIKFKYFWTWDTISELSKCVFFLFLTSKPPFKRNLSRLTFISFAKPLTGLCTNKPPCKISGIESFLPIKINLNRLTNKMMSASKFFWDVKSSLRKYLKVFTQLFAESSSCPKKFSYRNQVKINTFLK